MFIWDISNEKYHKGFPYTNINKILGKNNKIAKIPIAKCVFINISITQNKKEQSEFKSIFLNCLGVTVYGTLCA